MASHWEQYNFRRTKAVGTLTDEFLQQTFAEIDSDNSGYIDGEELSKAVKQWSQQTGQMAPSPKAMLAFADLDGDGRISVSEFIKVMRYEPPAASADVSSAGGAQLHLTVSLEENFVRFCSFGSPKPLTELDNAKFAKLCKDARLLDKKFTKTDVDLAFAKVCPKGKRKLTFAEFEQALRLVAAKKGCDMQHLHAAISAAAPSSSGTKADSGGIVGKMTDSSQYTGAHKHRFDADGHGKGLAGRDTIAKGHGNLPSQGLAGIADRSPADVRGVGANSCR